MELNQKRILITGASGGIGAHVAHALAEKGAILLLTGRNLAELERIKATLSHPERHHILRCDLTDSAARAALLEEPALSDGIDILIHNAGMIHFGWLEDQSEASVEKLLTLNTIAPIQLTRQLLPKIKRPGIVLNIGSAFGGIGYAGYSVYCASKFALRGFSEALGRELADSQIKVLYLAPRSTRTPLNSESVYAMNQELGVVSDSPEWVAGEVVASLEAESRYRWLGWPEKFFVRLNALLPELVDRALAAKLAIIRRYARNESKEKTL